MSVASWVQEADAASEVELDVGSWSDLQLLVGLGAGLAGVVLATWLYRIVARGLEERLLGAPLGEPAGVRLRVFDLVGVLLSYALSMIVVPTVYLIAKEGSFDAIDDDSFSDLGVVEQLGLTAAMHAVPAAFALLPMIRSRACGRVLGVGRSRAGLVAPFAALSYVAFLPLLFGLGWVNLMVFTLVTGSGPTQEIAEKIRDGMQDPTPWLFALAVLIVPLIEEILFRGFLLGFLRERTGAAVAVVLSSVAFALLHGYEAALPIFGLACVLATLRLRTGSLWAPWLVHALHNGLQTALLSAGVDP